MRKFSGTLSDDDRHEIARILEDGGVAILPTDTIYGLHAHALNENALLRICEIKKRQTPMSVIAPSVAWFEEQVAIERAREMSEKYAGPYTLLCPLSAQVSLPALLTSTGLVGVRFCEGVAADIARGFSLPLVTTSVNVHGEPALESIDDLSSEIEGQVDVIVDVGALRGRASTMVDFRESPERLVSR